MVPRFERPPFIGRSQELSTLLRLADEAIERGRKIVVVTGEAGVGKTRLVHELLSSLSGYEILIGRCLSPNAQHPLQPLISALGVDHALEALAAEEGPSVSESIGMRLTSMLNEVASKPTCLILEDVHFATDELIAIVEATTLPYVVMTCRPASMPDALTNLMTLSRALDMRLPRLEPNEALELAEGMLEARIGETLAAKVGSAGGNPLFVTQLLAAYQDESLFRHGNGTIDISSDASTPASLMSAMRHRLDLVDESSRQILSQASVLGATFRLSDLCRLMSRSASALAAPIASLISSGLLKELDESLSFSHELVREAAYKTIPSSVVKRLHVEAARVLAVRRAPPLEIALHYGQGAEPGDTEAISWLASAAREVVATSPDQAASLLDTALRVAGDKHPDAPLLMAEKASALVSSGRVTAGEAVARQVLALRPGGSAETAATLAVSHALMLQERVNESLEMLENSNVDDAGRVLAASAHQMSRAGALESSEVEARKALQTGIASGDRGAVSLSMAALAMTMGNRGYATKGLALAERALAEGPSVPDPKVITVLGFRRLHCDRFEEAVEAFQMVLRSAQSAWIPMAHLGLGAAGLHTGRWDDSEHHLSRCLEISEEMGIRSDISSALVFKAFIQFHTGDHAAARSTLERADEEIRASGYGFTRATNRARVSGLLSEAQGDLQKAFMDLTEAAEVARQSSRGHLRWVAPDLARVAIALGEPAEAHAAAEDLRDLAARSELESITGTWLMTTGLIDSDADALEQAAQILMKTGRVLEAAHAAEYAGDVLMSQGEDRTAERLNEALKAYDLCGASYDAARVRSKLRSGGFSASSRRARTRAETGWESLTPAEKSVAELVAEGLSNPQVAARLFISRRTVETHLARVFRKLQVSGRAELAATVVRSHSK